MARRKPVNPFAPTAEGVSESESTAVVRAPSLKRDVARRADVMFVLDTTGSMQFAIEGVKRAIGEVAEIYLDSRIHIRLGLIEFRDRTLAGGNSDPQSGLPMLERASFTEGEFTTNLNEFRGAVSLLQADGGGPEPESSFDALAEACRSSWQEGSARVLIHITDAPPRIPDREMKSAGDLVEVLTENQIDQLHTVNRGDDDFHPLALARRGPEIGPIRFFVYGITEDASSLVEELREIATVSSDSIESEDSVRTVSSELESDEEEDGESSNPFLSD